MCSTSVFPSIITMISNFTIFFIFEIFIFKFFFTNVTDFWFLYDCCWSFVNNFIFFNFKINYFLCMLSSGFIKLFMQSLPRYTSCLFSMLLNEGIVDIEKPYGICSLTFVEDDFAGFFLHPSIFSIIHSRSE